MKPFLFKLIKMYFLFNFTNILTIKQLINTFIKNLSVILQQN